MGTEHTCWQCLYTMSNTAVAAFAISEPVRRNKVLFGYVQSARAFDYIARMSYYCYIVRKYAPRQAYIATEVNSARTQALLSCTYTAAVQRVATISQ